MKVLWTYGFLFSFKKMDMNSYSSFDYVELQGSRPLHQPTNYFGKRCLYFFDHKDNFIFN